AGIYFRWVPLPPRRAGRALAAFWVIMIISTLYMSSGWRVAGHPEAKGLRWMGWDQVLLIWGAMGLFLSAMCAGAYEKTSVWFVRYLVVQWLVVNLIGFMMFDFTENNHHSIVTYIFNLLYPKNSQSSSPLFQLLITLKGADNQL